MVPIGANANWRQPTISVPSRPYRDPHTVSGWELISLSGLLWLYFLADGPINNSMREIANIVGPCLFSLILGCGATRMIRIDASCLWSAVFWFRVATAVYFGFGNFVPAIMNDATLSYVKAFFQFSEQEHLKLNIIVTASALLIFLGASIRLRYRSRYRQPSAQPAHDSLLLLTGFATAAVGFGFKLLVVLPYTMGSSDGGIVSGIVMKLGLLSNVSIYLLTRYTVHYRPAFLPLMVCALLADMTVGVLQFNKSEVIMPLMMFLLAWLGHRVSLSRVLISAAVVLTVISLVIPITQYGRDRMWERYNALTGAGLVERARITGQYFQLGVAETPEGQIQRLYSRLSYVNQGSLAIHEYDQGRPGTSLRNAFIVWIPRLIWPDKPIITNLGREFYELATGRVTSAASPGIFAESYWCLGWSGLIPVMLGLGVFFGELGRFGVLTIASRRWLQFPVLVIAMRMGTRVDGALVVDYIGPAGMMIAIYIVMRVVENLVGVNFGEHRRDGRQIYPLSSVNVARNMRPD